MSTSKVPKLKINLGSATKDLTNRAQAAAKDRFETADEISQERPEGLVSRFPASAPVREASHAPAGSAGSSLSAPPGVGFDPAACHLGMVYDVPLGLIDPNPDGARVFYRSADVDRIAESLQKNEQDEAANGFVENDRVVLIDGGTRLRSARVGGLASLLVRIRAKPASRKELFKESMRLNDERRDHTALDLAVMISRLVTEGVYASQDEAAADLCNRDGSQMTKPVVSMYMRIGKIPARLMRLMADNDRTCQFTVAYEISAIFAQSDYAENEDKYQEIAQAVIEEVQSAELSKKQVVALVQSKLQGPKQRLRGEKSVIHYAGAKGTLNVFAARGQLDFSVRGLAPEQCEELRAAVERICASATQAPGAGASGGAP
jgi:ParB family chromosome partitioning protein